MEFEYKVSISKFYHICSWCIQPYTPHKFWTLNSRHSLTCTRRTEHCWTWDCICRNFQYKYCRSPKKSNHPIYTWSIYQLYQVDYRSDNCHDIWDIFATWDCTHQCTYNSFMASKVHKWDKLNTMSHISSTSCQSLNSIHPHNLNNFKGWNS